MREELHVAKVERREDHIVQRGVDSSVGEAIEREVRFEAHSESSSAAEQGSPCPPLLTGLPLLGLRFQHTITL